MHRQGRTEIIRRVEDLDQLTDSWNALASASTLATVTPAWVISAAEALCPQSELCVVVHFDQDGVCDGVAPLVLDTVAGQPALVAISSTRLFEPMSILFRDRSVLRELLRKIRREPHPAVLTRVPSDDPLVRELRRSRRGLASFTVTRPRSNSLRIRVESDWKSYEATISSRRRSDLRRFRRRAEALGPLTFEVVTPSAARCDEYLSRFMDTEHASWKGRQGSSLKMDEPQSHFFRSLCPRLGRGRKVLFGFMYVNGRAVAGSISAIQGGEVLVLKVGCDEEFKRCAPGVLLMHEVLRWVFDNELDGLDFSGEVEPWLRVWPSSEHRHASVRLYPYSRGGVRALVGDVARWRPHRALEIAT